LDLQNSYERDHASLIFSDKLVQCEEVLRRTRNAAGHFEDLGQNEKDFGRKSTPWNNYLQKLFLNEFFQKEDKSCVFFVADAFWVGASDIGQKPGQFVWQSDGTKVARSLWRSGEPNDFGAGKETCAHLWTSFGKLFDFRCSHPEISFICELADEDLPC